VLESKTMKSGRGTVYLTLSLASGERAEALKVRLKELAQKNNRSVSNQCAIILQQYVDREGA
jgi:hypothetical protein|tara:strand:- start:199 stop:384 length:186 start_codon:yes stop_codon:yes gene_type:complete